MLFMEMLFKLILRFCDISSSKVDELRLEANKDIEKRRDLPGAKPTVAGKLIVLQEHWLSQVLMCFVGIGLARWITAWLTSPIDSEEEEEDDEEAQQEAILKLVSQMNKNKKAPVAFTKL